MRPFDRIIQAFMSAMVSIQGKLTDRLAIAAQFIGLQLPTSFWRWLCHAGTFEEICES